MADVDDYIPLDKSWIIRMGFLDLINGYSDYMINFLEKQEKLSDDLKALKKVAEKWNTQEPLDVGESATLYRITRFYFWKKGEDREIIKRGTLIKRKICNNPDIVNWPLEKLISPDLDYGTSQWASAAVLMGNRESIIDMPEKLKLNYEAIADWSRERYAGKCWPPRHDKTIERQARAYVDCLQTGKINFEPKHSEDYCFAKAFGLISSDEGMKRFPSLIGHESNRIDEMKKAVLQAYNNEIVDSKDHRVIQAIAMMQESRSMSRKIMYPLAVNKSWPLFWDFLDYAIRFKR